MAEKKHLIRGVTVLVFILIVWVLYVSSKQVERNRRIEQEVTVLQNEALKIRRENETLAEKISYFSSSDFQEREAKEKLGMKKNDESVVVIKQRPGNDGEADTGKELKKEIPQENIIALPNYRKWWQLFF